MDAAILTLFVPAAILGVIDVILFLRIFCLISSHQPRTPTSHLSPTTTTQHLPPHSKQGRTPDMNGGSSPTSEHDIDTDDRNKELLPSNHNSSVNFSPLNQRLASSFTPSSNQPLVDSYAEFVTSSNHSDSASGGGAPHRSVDGGGGGGPTDLMAVLPDTAYRPMSHLLASVVILLLYCATWTAGALAIALPFSDDTLPHADIVFQVCCNNIK